MLSSRIWLNHYDCDINEKYDPNVKTENVDLSIININRLLTVHSYVNYNQNCFFRVASLNVSAALQNALFVVNATINLRD